MPKAITDYKFWFGIASFWVTAAGIVFYGGKSVQRQDTIIEVLAKIERQLPVLAEKINNQDMRIAILEERLKHNQ